ncbi:hypothetical protein MJM45_32095, partial [Salmonella enterica subsp. enterica serovar Kentucky]|nr:hypothetical protein [Salmonella enterica subsp. enterica serovar Kentucky]
DLLDNLRAAGVALTTIEQLQQRAEQLTGKPQPIEFTDRVVAVADDLNVVANVFLSHNPTLWPTIFSQLSTQPEIFEDEDEDEYG